jgi:hypothetical protein
MPNPSETQNKRGLCWNCDWCTHTVDRRGRESLYCSSLSMQLREVVVKCSGYQARETISKRELEKSAWILEFRKKVGFETPVPEFYKPENAGD